MRTILMIFAAALVTSSAAAQPGVGMRAKKGHVAANGVNYYYEVHGSGEPLLLLHGGLGSIGMFGPLLPALAANRQVIAIDLHGHGRTALGERSINYIDMADDLAVVLRELGYGQVDVMGYSFGGATALRLAIQHPALVRRLVVASSGYATHGTHADILPMQAQVGPEMAEAMKDTPMFISYAAVAPRPEDFPRLLGEMGALMRRQFDWAEEVRTLRMPVMLVFGDSDMLTLDHVISFYKLLGGGQRDAGWQREHMSQNRLAILPDLTHYEVFMAPQLVTTVLPFLDGESRPPVWADQVRGSP
jgi:pimeloyl-ACP methyl ester carboxylesterase